MKYLHVSKTGQVMPNGTIQWSIGTTYDVGKNKAKRERKLLKKANYGFKM